MNMISALIHNGADTLVLDLPTGLVDFQLKLLSVGIRQRPETIQLTDNENDDIQVKLFSNNKVGTHLVQVFEESDTLADANLTANMITSSNDPVKAELEQRIRDDRYNSPRELLRDIRISISEKMVRNTKSTR
ncbi:MAG: hypothetical protein PHR18_04215 [Oscillospiraceae bacterium]|nr:hypothetical protein [Oscillospiraceae bacterium]